MKLIMLKFHFPLGDWWVGSGFKAIKRASEINGVRVQSNIYEMIEIDEFKCKWS